MGPRFDEGSALAVGFRREQQTMSLFQSFFMGGFECSTHKRPDGVRLDLSRATRHNVLAADDYRMLAAHGIRAVRDGLRWHLVEPRSGQYDFASFLPMLRAARDTGTQVVWDLFHYGYPNGLDIWSPRFVERFAAYVRAVATLVRNETDTVPWWCPVNEMSFFAWGAGDVAALNPFARGRGGEMKAQLVRASIAAIEACRDVDPRARFICAEPLINVIPKDPSPEALKAAQTYFWYQFEATDMLTGRLRPELGGKPDYLDVYGANYYYNNQWIDGGRSVYLGDWLYKPLSELLGVIRDRYQRPLFIAETGTEAGFRAPWLHYVCDEVAIAREQGTMVEGICLYPILSHPGWDDDRRVPNGLFDATLAGADRSPFAPLAEELARQQGLFAVRGIG